MEQCIEHDLHCANTNKNRYGLIKHPLLVLYIHHRICGFPISTALFCESVGAYVHYYSFHCVHNAMVVRPILPHIVCVRTLTLCTSPLELCKV